MDEKFAPEIRGHPIPIFIDDRERGCAAAAELEALPEFSCAYQRLDLGDYQVDGKLLVERKTLRDFVASIEDGRIFRQTWRMADSAWRPLLILEGRTGDLQGCAMRREAMQGALLTVSLIWGIPVLRAQDGAETARLILFAARQLRQAVRGIVFRPGRRPRGKRQAQLWLLQGLPGVGPRRAKALLERFHNVEAVMAADEAALMESHAIAKKIAQGIRWAVSEAQVPYTACENRDCIIRQKAVRLIWEDTLPSAISKARLEARIPSDVHEILKRAAEIQGRTMTDFVVSAVREVAQRAIEESEVVRLTLSDSKKFAAKLLSPPKPTLALKRAFARRHKLLGVE